MKVGVDEIDSLAGTISNFGDGSSRFRLGLSSITTFLGI